MSLNGENETRDIGLIRTGSLAARRGAGDRRLPARAHRRDLRPGVDGEDHAHAARHAGGAARGRRRGVHRRRARVRRHVRALASASTPTRLLVSQPDNGEQALEIAEMLARSGAVDVMVVDSVAALMPKAEIEGDMGDAHMGLQARLMSQALREAHGRMPTSTETTLDLHQPAPPEDRRRLRQSRRRPPAATRSSSTRACGSTCAGWAR